MLAFFGIFLSTLEGVEQREDLLFIETNYFQQIFAQFCEHIIHYATHYKSTNEAMILKKVNHCNPESSRGSDLAANKSHPFNIPQINQTVNSPH